MKHIPLSPMDYYFYRRSLYTIQFIFEYRGELDEKLLARALSRTAEVVPAIGSRLKKISSKELVLETGHPVSLHRQALDQDPLGPISARDFLRAIENKEEAPLVSVLLTKTPAKTYVGFSFSHMIGDGASFFHFLQIVTDFCCDQKTSRSVSNARHLLQIQGPSREQQNSLFQATGYVIPRPMDPVAVHVETLRLSYRELENQKRIFKSQGVFVSSNDILMAELAKRSHQDIPRHDGQFLIRCPVDCRKVYGLPPTYFGNAVRDAIAAFRPDEIEEMSLAEVARRIRESILAVDKKAVYQALQALDDLRKTEGLEIFENLGCPGLLVSNLSKFPIHQINLGSGAPIGFHHASLNPRLGLILPTIDGVEVRFKRPVDSLDEVQ